MNVPPHPSSTTQQRLPRRPQPESGEYLGHWLQRVADDNLSSATSLFGLSPGKARFPSKNRLQQISLLTDVKVRDLKALGLGPYAWQTTVPAGYLGAINPRVRYCPCGIEPGSLRVHYLSYSVICPGCRQVQQHVERAIPVRLRPAMNKLLLEIIDDLPTPGMGKRNRASRVKSAVALAHAIDATLTQPESRAAALQSIGLPGEFPLIPGVQLREDPVLVAAGLIATSSQASTTPPSSRRARRARAISTPPALVGTGMNTVARALTRVDPARGQRFTSAMQQLGTARVLPSEAATDLNEALTELALDTSAIPGHWWAPDELPDTRHSMRARGILSMALASALPGDSGGEGRDPLYLRTNALETAAISRLQRTVPGHEMLTLLADHLIENYTTDHTHIRDTLRSIRLIPEHVVHAFRNEWILSPREAMPAPGQVLWALATGLHPEGPTLRTGHADALAFAAGLSPRARQIVEEYWQELLDASLTRASAPRPEIDRSAAKHLSLGGRHDAA